jgi:YYY domain-containing protein
VLDAVLFWIVVAGLGIVGLPFAELLLGRLPTRGLAFARPLGLLLAAFPVWLLASLHIVRYSRISAFASIGVLVAVSILLRRRGLGRIGGDRSVWLAGEAVFTIAFAGWAVMRSYVPDVWQTEKPMDMAIVNAINRSPFFPPHDPWLAGTHVNYYYFGHYLVAFVTRVTGIDPAVAFNLGVALFYALAATSVFAVAAALYAAARRTDRAPARSPVLAGLTAAVFATAVGNLAGGVQLLQHTNAIASYDWWTPSRVIAGTANEFPFFSFLLADLHAHVMATPFALLTVAYAVQLAIAGPPIRGEHEGRRRLVAELLLAALVLGALYPTNSFDFPTACLIGAGSLLVWTLGTRRRRRRALTWGAGWLVLAVVLFLPFWTHFTPPAHGIGLIRQHSLFSHFLRDYVLIYGLPLWVVLAIFAGRFRGPRRYFVWGGSAAVFVLVLLSPSKLAGPAVALFLAAAAVFAVFGSGRFSQTYRVYWLLVAVALGLLASGELVYLRDAFNGTASYRFNTVFKTGYQAWFLLAVVAGVGVHWSASWLAPRVRVGWLGVLIALGGLALVYPVLGSYSRELRFDRSPTLDGMQWLEEQAPNDAAAIDWLRQSVRGAPIVLEAPGPDFDPQGSGRVSTFTGLPALAEWPGHEVQWGHSPGSLTNIAQLIFKTDDLAYARNLLRRYDVRYVFVGTLERRAYSRSELAKFAQIGTPAFRRGSTVVYQLPA